MNQCKLDRSSWCLSIHTGSIYHVGLSVMFALLISYSPSVPLVLSLVEIETLILCFLHACMHACKLVAHGWIMDARCLLIAT